MIFEYKFKGVKHQGLTEMPDNLGEYDLIILLSANSQFDYQAIAEKHSGFLIQEMLLRQ